MSLHPIRHDDAESTASIVYIDPEMAYQMLTKNTRNRPISELHVQRLMDEMYSGRWQYNGEAIKWSVDDVLLDGQNRLIALSRLDDSYSFPFLVVRGLPTKAQDTMDQGRTRTASDQLNIDGLTGNGTDSRVIAGAIRVYIQWLNDGLFGDAVANRVGNSEVIQWARQHPVELGVMGEILTARLRRVKTRPSLTLAILLRLHLRDNEAALEFSEGLYSGAGLHPTNPILTLRERLDRIRTQGLRTPDRDIIAFFIVAWNAWRSGRTMERLQRPPGGAWTLDTFPVIR